MAAPLRLRDVTLAFGGVRVLEDVSVDVAPGQVMGLVGPNGARSASAASPKVTRTSRTRSPRRR